MQVSKTQSKKPTVDSAGTAKVLAMPPHPSKPLLHQKAEEYSVEETAASVEKLGIPDPQSSLKEKKSQAFRFVTERTDEGSDEPDKNRYKTMYFATKVRINPCFKWVCLISLLRKG